MCSFWINTNFIKSLNPVIKLTKSEIDKACKDKKHKLFDENFSIELHFEVLSLGYRVIPAIQPASVGNLKTPQNID